MLIKLPLTAKIDGLHVEITPGTEYLINPNRIKELETFDSTGSQFLYIWNPEDEKCDAMYFQSTDTVASIISAADDSPNSSFVALSVYEDDDRDELPVTKYYRVDDIVFGVERTNFSELWVAHGGKRVVRILVYHDLDAILNLADTGTTTTWLMS